jgi:YhcG PDDEXK nuclease domain
MLQRPRSARTPMNAVEIEQAISDLALQPFDAAEFPFAFLAAFGNKDTTLKRLRAGNNNASDVPGGVLQRSNIDSAVCPPGTTGAGLHALPSSPATPKGKARFILATDGQTLEAEDPNCRKRRAYPSATSSACWPSTGGTRTALDAELVPQPVAQAAAQPLAQPGGAAGLPLAVAGVPATLPLAVPRGHHAALMEKVKDAAARHWYVHLRAGQAASNFSLRLPAPGSALVQQTLKDPYLFDFLTINEPFHERELETGLIAQLETFLPELGQGFALVGRQYGGDLGEQDAGPAGRAANPPAQHRADRACAGRR